ncbi:hypothetical protein NDR87_01680 [Nocardia sp. CDC159]|uniref:Uncharacterized protein n=1 Tax=Nocardia pulmonis TaxID=2951408 RepID=A0A9X2E290_9NOCA|nr:MULTISPECIES: hypothetical protein [Nocardia]MCM6772280.1 hypothetical protein [Nocardia pulmonis]MCM6785062.1 hypothetical protein [Nocardia sp. CDC159]
MALPISTNVLIPIAAALGAATLVALTVIAPQRRGHRAEDHRSHADVPIGNRPGPTARGAAGAALRPSDTSTLADNAAPDTHGRVSGPGRGHDAGPGRGRRAGPGRGRDVGPRKRA